MLFKKIILLVCMLLAASGAANAAYEFQDTQHNTVTPATLAGKWVIVTYWAAWCGACSEETPGLNHLYQTNQQNNVLVYGVNFDGGSADEISAGAQRLGIQFPVLLQDPRDTWGFGSILYLPTTFIINPDGKLVEKIVGAHTEESFLSLLAALRK